MIGLEEAKRIVLAKVVPLQETWFDLVDALGHYLSNDNLVSPVDHPLFPCSAVDGYAFAFDGRNEWKVVREVAAGQHSDVPVRPGECARIFTGAMMPMFTDTVVMQEFVKREGGMISHTDHRLTRFANVRQAGEQARAGDIVHERGSMYDPASIGLLAGLGLTRVPASPRPKVGVLVTGDEFAATASPRTGRIFSSNDAMLEAALRKEGIRAVVRRCGDQQGALCAAIDALRSEVDVLVTTGGVSVGDHDLVEPALMELGATMHFHGVAQKPGKPMLFASLKTKPVFGLPGNPRAVMILFWEYVLPFLRAMQGAREPALRSEPLPLVHAVNAKGERAEFRAAQVKGGTVALLANEGSHMLRSLALADAIAYLPAGRGSWAQGERIEVHYLPR